jgi:hypothetical protein
VLNPQAVIENPRQVQYSRTIADLFRPGLVGAVGATVNFTPLLNAVADDSTPALRTGRRQRLNRALERIERMALARHDYFE